MGATLSFRGFVIGILAGTGAVLALVALFNRVVDPFWYYRDVSIEGFNAVKTKFRRYERHVKPAILARERPQAVSIGSSFAEIGFDPLSPAFTDNGRLKGYNLGIGGATWEVQYCYFEYALSHTRLERVVMGIHLTSLPRVDCARQLAEMKSLGAAELLFSGRALRASWETVLGQRKEKPSHSPEGLYYYARRDPNADRRFREFFSARFKAQPCDRAKLAAAGPAPAALPEPRAAGQLDLEGLRWAVRQAREQGFELRLVIYPEHAYHVELDGLCGQDAYRWDALAQIARAVAEEAQGSEAIQLWEFMGYNAVTGEPVRGPMVYWQDPGHFNSEVGDMMLAQMFGGAAPGAPRLGRRVTPDTVEESRRSFEEGRLAFISANPWFYPGLRALVPGGDKGIPPRIGTDKRG